jgi:hypothetical protein
MAGNAIIGALRVVLGADTAQLETGLKSAQNKIAAFGASAVKAAAGIGLAIGAMAGAVAVGVKNTIDEADKLGKSAQKWGVGVEELSKLKHAADLSDVSLESLGKGMARLSKTMVEAAAKPTSEAANAFRALGVDVKNADGTLKSSTQVISDVAGKFENLKDGAGKTAVSMALFGKSGADLIPMLNAGKTGLQGMMDEAAKLGIVFDTQTAKSAEAFNDNLTRLGKVKDGIILKITAGMLPSLENLSNSMIRVAGDGERLSNIGRTIGDTFVWLFNAADRLTIAWQRLGIEWQAFKNLVSTVPFTEASKKAWQEYNATGAETARILENLRVVHETAGLADAFGNVAAKVPPATTALKDFNYQAMAGKNAVDQFLASQEKRLISLQAETQAFGLSAGAKERLQIVEQTLATAQANGLTLTEAQRAKMVELAFATEQYKMRLAGLQLAETVLPPFEQFNQSLQKNKELFDAGVISIETYARANQKVAEQAGATWHQAGESIAGSIADIGKAFGKENKAMATVAKVAGAIQATISMFVGAAKALELPFPANIAAVAAVIAKGAALVASIKGTAVSGFQTGGQFRVPGGVGGGDKVMAAFEPGEIVDVWRPGEPGGDPRGGGAGATRTIRLEGQGFIDGLSGSSLRRLFEMMNEQLRDDGMRFEIAR